MRNTTLAANGNGLSVYRATLQQRRGWFAGIALLMLAVFAADSVWRPRFLTEAAILIPPHDEWGGLEALARNIVTNERFLSTQLAVLTSDIVLSHAWSLAHQGALPTDDERRNFRRSITTVREPFNNLVTIRLSQPRTDLIDGLLAAFEARFRHNALSVAEQRAAVVRLSLAAAVGRIETLEAELAAIVRRGGSRRAGPSAGTTDTTAHEDHAREARRISLISEMDAAHAARLAAAAELREVLSTIEQRTRFIEVVSGPSRPERTNPISWNVARGLVAGLLLDLLVLYLLVVWRPAGRGP